MSPSRSSGNNGNGDGNDKAGSPEARDKEIPPYIEALKTSKRNFSAVSAASCRQDAEREKLSPRQRRASLQEDLLKQFDARIDVLNSEVNLRERQISLVVASWANGTLDVTRQQQRRAQVEQLEKEVMDFRAKFVILLSQKNQIAGELLDLDAFVREKFFLDWPLVDSIIARLRSPEKATHSLFQARDENEQARFREDVLRAYGAVKASADCKRGDTDLAWCCVTGEWTRKAFVTAAHIVPYNIGHIQANYLFGPPTDARRGHLMSPANGLPMEKGIKERFDDAQISIQPVAGTNDFKIVTFDTEDKRAMAFDGKTLQFPNNFRPAKRYLYFAYVCSLLRRQRHEVPRWWKGRHKHGLQEMWATPGDYLRRSTLSALARRIGHLPPNEAAALFFNEKGPLETGNDERDELVSASAQLSPYVERKPV